MHKPPLYLLVSVILISIIIVAPGSVVGAQGPSFPAEMNKSFTPISIVAGGTSRLMVSIFNPNPFQLTNASWTDNLVGVQPGILIANPVNLSNSCGGTVTAVPGGTTLSLSGGTVPAQVGTTPGSCTVAIDVTSTTLGNLINTIPAGALTSTGGGLSVTNTSPASATLHVGGVQPPTINKSFSPGSIWVGQTSQLSIAITNNDFTTTLTQASLTDDLPANVFLANPVSSTLSGCGGSASLNAVSGGTSVTLINATIAPNSTCTIRVNVTSNTQGSYLNTIPANALQTQQGLTNASPDSARLNVQEIGITKAFSPSSFAAGGTSTLTITLQNPTGSPYTGVSVSDTLPGSVLTVVPGSAATTCGGTVSVTPPRTVSLTGGTIPAGSVTSPGTCTITFQVTAPADTPSATYLNTIPANSLTTNQGVSNVRPATASVTIAGADVTGIKSFSPSTIVPGGNSRLRIEIFAPGDTDLTNFSITDDLPAGLTVSNSTAPATSGCGVTPPLVLTATTGATSISLTNGLIPAGQRCRIDVFVTGSTTGVYTNTIPPANITNNENRIPAGPLTANLTVGDLANLSMAVVKGFNPLTVFGGSASTMSIQLLNSSNVAVIGITLTDNMPTGMILANPLNFNVGTCGGTLSGTPGANTFSFSGGSLPAGGTCTLTLSVTMTVNGNLTNTIPANAVTTTNGISNPDPAEASLTNLPGASVSKFFSPNPIAAGSYSLLTIRIQNTGNVALSGMGLIDNLPGTLPAGLVIANPPAPAPINICGGTLSAMAGTQIIQLTNGSLAASSSCTIVAAVTGSTPGDYQNTIPAGTLISDQGATNHNSASDTLVVTANSVGGGGGGGRGRGATNTPDEPVAGGFLIPLTGFSPNTVTRLDSSARPAYDAMSLTMEIPVIKLKTSIAGVQLKKGGWDVSWLRDQAGWLNGTAYPTWKGNSVLTAHVVNADGKPGVFSRLKYLGVGEYIFVYNSGYRYTYKVVSNEFVQPDDITVLRHEEKSYLTLITCDSYDEKTGSYLRRVSVRAVLVDVREVK
jgi:LPXTG-site transpeptidase (sortase) family protein